MEQKTTQQKINFWARISLRIMAWFILLTYTIFKIIKPVSIGDKISLDTNDGYVIGGSILLLLAVEVVRKIAVSYAKKKLNIK